MPIVLNNFPEYRPYSNVQPFTVRDGATYLLQLEALKDWLRDYVIPHINTETGELAESWKTQTEFLIENWNTLSVQLVAQVQTIADGADADAQAAQTARLAAEAARDLAEQFASEAAEVQDAAITGIFNNTSSLFRQAADGVYALSADLDAVEATLASGRLSEATLDARFGEKAAATDLDAVEAVITSGRLSETTLDGRFGAIEDQIVDLDDKANKNLRGTYAARPNPAGIEDGVIYVATNIPEQYICINHVWYVTGSGGNELAYAEITSSVSTTSTTPVAIPGLTTSFVAGERPVYFEICADIGSSVANNVASVRLFVDGVQVKELNVGGLEAGRSIVTSAGARKTFTPGTNHTITVQYLTGLPGTVTVHAFSHNPAYVKAVTA